MPNSLCRPGYQEETRRTGLLPKDDRTNDASGASNHTNLDTNDVALTRAIAGRQELSQKGLMPTLLDFERTFRLSITDVFLKEKGISNEERIWFYNQLPKSLYHLRRARNRAEHVSAGQWTRQDLSKFYDEFIGIGRPGILPELCRILLF